MLRIGKTTKRLCLALAVIGVGAGLIFGSGAIARSGLRTPAKQSIAGSWQELPAAPIAMKYGPTSVWTGEEMIVSDVEAAEAYDPTVQEWRRLPAPPEMDNYCRRSTVWTGSEMLVWGCSQAAYSPERNEWRRLPRAPTRQGIVAWTGKELIGWGGGCCGDVSDDGSAYKPKTNTWRKLAPAPVGGQQSPTGAWTGRELVILSGRDPDGKPVGGAAYNPATDTWRRIPPPPEPRPGAIAVWDGNEIFVVGGYAGGDAALAFNPSNNHWRQLPRMKLADDGLVALWTGRWLLVSSGKTAAYDPVTDRWASLPDSPLPAREGAVAVWTGQAMIAWGGVIGTPQGTSTEPRYLVDGAALYPRRIAWPTPPLPQCCGGG